MALDFPTNPTNGQGYQGYFWDGTDEVWKLSPTPPILEIDDISNVDTNGVSDGQALVYNADNSEWVAGDVAAGPEPAKTITSDNIALDFSDGIELEQRTVTGDVTFTASNYTSGAKKTVYLEGDTVSRNLTFPAAWNFITDKPTAIGASKKNILDLNSFGTSESTTVALWLGASAFDPIVATGGTVSNIEINGVQYQVHVFTTSGDFVVGSVGDDSTAEYLVLGGGGGGGNDHGGGGGAGGLVVTSNSIIDTTYSAIVGLGGQGALSVRDGSTMGTSGGNSSIFGTIAYGGGRGGSYTNGAPENGGSGGGGGGDGDVGGQPIAGQGYAGGNGSSSSPSYQGGGGGGAGGVGAPGTTNSNGPNGGNGFSSAISGSDVVYGGGGGGCSAYDGVSYGLGGSGGGGRGATNTAVAVSGTNGLGGGGGGANRHGAGGSHASSSIGTAGNGGSGLVIIRYPITDPN